MNPTVTRRRAYLALAVLFCFAGFATAQQQQPQRPNIILIMADDMGYETVGANGSADYPTPNIDRLAEQGMRFEHCHSQPICTPSRVQIMSGIYNHRNYTRFGQLDPKATTFANELRRAGYATAITGKWQLGSGFDGPGRFGFDEYCLWQLTRRPNRYPNPGLEINGEQKDFKPGGYGPAVVNDYAIDFIKRHHDKPFFLYYPMIAPHWPFEPTPDSPDWDPLARINDETELSGGPHTSKRHFRDMVMHVDKMVGRVVETLDELGITERTIVIFTADNGTYERIITRTEDGLEITGGKGKTSDNGTRVPLIVSQPGTIPSGAVDKHLVDFSDFYPTLLELAGSNPQPDTRLDGISFADRLHGKPGATTRQITYCWYQRNGERPIASQHTRTTRYKLYIDGRFFDTHADLYEQSPLNTENLSPELQQVHQQLQQTLNKYATEAAAFPQP